ncbi:MAG TPA: hypothetical protein VM659_14595, partial [Dongiaceae bacterium]|nr:hypothetical protein [Dongiaceae bacterium]
QKERQAALIRKAIDLHVAATEAATGKKMTPSDHDALLQQAAAPNVLTSRSSKGMPGAILGAIAPAVGLGGGVGEALGGGAALAGEGALASTGPLALLVAGILAATSKSTASPALDEYQSPITTELPNSPGMPVPTTVERQIPRSSGKDCDKQYNACNKICVDSWKTKADQTKGIYHTSFDKCMKGCLSVECGGNARSEPIRRPKKRRYL